MNPYKKGTKEYEEQFKRYWEESMKEAVDEVISEQDEWFEKEFLPSEQGQEFLKARDDDEAYDEYLKKYYPDMFTDEGLMILE